MFFFLFFLSFFHVSHVCVVRVLDVCPCVRCFLSFYDSFRWGKAQGQMDSRVPVQDGLSCRSVLLGMEFSFFYVIGLLDYWIGLNNIFFYLLYIVRKWILLTPGINILTLNIRCKRSSVDEAQISRKHLSSLKKKERNLEITKHTMSLRTFFSLSIYLLLPRARA